jgi:indolepyruvate ferredoxin oxidoreductase
VKKAYGPWIATAYRVLAKAKGLRGTALDVFGYTQERRQERLAVGEFVSLMRLVVAQLTPEKLNLALELARLPQTVRGFGHVKEHNAELAQQRNHELLAQFNA